MTPSEKLRELAELSEKSRHGGIEDTFQFRNALMDWYRTEGRQLAEDGLRWRAGCHLYFPEFCGHDDSAPKGCGWFHQRLTGKWFDDPNTAIDAARGEIT